MNAHRRSGKEDKQVKQHDYGTSSQSDEGLYHNTSKCSTLYIHVPLSINYTLVVCYHVQSKCEKGSYLHG